MNKTKIVEPLENAKDLMEEKITPLIRKFIIFRKIKNFAK